MPSKNYDGQRLHGMQNMNDWPRCGDCGRWINFGHPFAKCWQEMFLDMQGEPAERDECICGPCAEKDQADAQASGAL